MTETAWTDPYSYDQLSVEISADLDGLLNQIRSEAEQQQDGMIDRDILRMDFKQSFDNLFTEILSRYITDPDKSQAIQYNKSLFRIDCKLKLESVIDRVQIMQRLRRWKDMPVEDLDEDEENQQYDEKEEDE